MTNWRAVWTVFFAGLVAGAYITKVAPALPGLRETLGLSLVESGLIATMFNAIGMIVGMLAGVLCDRFGQKRLALAGLVILALGGVLGAAASTFALLLLTRFLEGVGFLLFAVSAPSLLSAASSNERDRARALGLWSAYVPTGGTLALVAAPALIGAWDWRGLWVALALGAAIMAVVFARNVPAARYGEVNSLRLVAESLSRPGNLVMAALFAFYVAQWNSIMLWLPTFLVERSAASTGTAALATALMVAMNAPGGLGGGWLLGRGLRRGNLVVAASVIGAACEMGAFSEALPGPLRYVLVLAFSLATGIIPAAIFGGLPVHARTAQHIATGNGIVMQASQAGQFLGPLALAWAASRFGGLGHTLWLLLVFAAGSALCGLALRRIEPAGNVRPAAS